MEILEQHSVMIQGHIQPDYAQKLSGVELDDAVHVRLSAFMNKLAAAGAGDTNARLNRLEESITEVLTSRVLGQIHTQITTPLAREGSRQTGLIDRISDKIEEGAGHLRDAFNKSRIENGARIVDLNTISNNGKAAWVNPDDAGIAGGSDKNGKAAGDTPNGQEEVEGLPWLKKEDVAAAIDEQNSTSTTKKPPPPTKPKPLSKKAAEDAAGERVVGEMKRQQELLGQPVTIPDNPLLKLNLNPQPVEQEQIAESSGPKTLSDVGNNLFKDFLAPDKMGTSEFMNPLKMSWSAAMEIKEYIEENAIYGIMKIPGGRYTLEKVSAVMQPVSTVLHAGAEGAAKLVLTEQEISVLKQKFNEQPNGIQILGRDILEILLFGGATKVASTTFKTAATITKPLAKAGLDSLKSTTNKAAAIVSEVGDSLLPPLNPAFAGLGAGFESAEKSAVKSTTVFTAEVMEPTPASVVKKIETTAGSSSSGVDATTSLGAKKKVSDLAKKFDQASSVKEKSEPPPVAPKPKSSLIKKFEEQTAAEASADVVKKKLDLDTAISESHISEPVKYEASSTLTAKEVVVENPYIVKHYLNEIETLTEQGAVHPKQIPLLKDALREQDFSKLDILDSIKHRNHFGNVKNNLIREWEINTGKEWPVYDKDYFKTSAEPFRYKGNPLDAHHIIQVSHGGPNEWWNIHPAHFEEHRNIHGTKSVAREIFNSKIKK